MQQAAHDKIGMPLSPSDASAILAVEEVLSSLGKATDSSTMPAVTTGATLERAQEITSSIGQRVGSREGVGSAGASLGAQAAAMAERNVNVGVLQPTAQGWSVVPGKVPYARPYSLGDALQVYCCLSHGRMANAGNRNGRKTPFVFCGFFPNDVPYSLQSIEELHLGEAVPVTEEIARAAQRAEVQASPGHTVEKGGISAHLQAAADKNKSARSGP